MLNWAPLAWLGRISYSLYLWQQPFLAPGHGSLIHRFPINIALSVAVAWGSYLLIERPCLRVRDRWWPARSSAGVQASRPIVTPAAALETSA